MATTTNNVTMHAADPRSNEPMELARYMVPSGERKLVGRRVAGEAILVDVPAGDDGRVYLVERHLDEDGYSALLALVADYVAMSQAIQSIPAAARHLDSPGTCRS